MNQPFLIINEAKIPNTHFFSYRSNKYPFNFDIFKYISNYLYKKQVEFQQSTIIELIDAEYEDEINLSDKSINDFINFCHNQRIEIHNQNAIELNFLAKKYEVSSLIENTDYYITSHIDDLILQKLSLFNGQQQLEFEKYEDMIAEKLLDYINDDRLLSLSFPVIHRILTKYFLKSNKSDIMPFLFKCLDKYGREASILFSNIDFGNEKAEHLNTLLTKYSKIFDFHFINSSLAKTLYETQSNIIQKEELMERQQKELLDLFNSQMSQIRQEIIEMKNNYDNEIQRQKQLEEEKTEKLNSQIAEMKNEISKMKIDHQNEIQKQKQLEEEKINGLNNQIDEMKKEMNKMNSDYLNEIQNQMQTNDEKINELKEKMNKLGLENKNFKEKAEQSFKIIDQTSQLKEIVIKNVSIESFNQLKGDAQVFVINKILSQNKSKSLLKIHDLLSYLISEYQKLNINFNETNRIFIPTDQNEIKTMNFYEYINYKNSIGLRKSIIEVFYKNKINDLELKSRISQFDHIYLEIQYPSIYFNDAYEKVKNTKIKIELLVSDIHQSNNIFKNNSNISSIMVNDSIDSIKDNFRGCSSLKEVFLSQSMKSIENNAFNLCSSLTQISIPSSLTSINEYAFSGCSSLKEINIPDSVTTIESSAFKRCISLVKINIPNSVNSIGSLAFRECISLNKIDIPSSVTAIGRAAFFNCSSLIDLNIPPSLIKIEKNLFKGCILLKSINIPPSVTSIEIGAFSRCFLLSQITIPSSVTSIEEWTFSECSSLSQVTIPSSVTTIKNYSFEKCTSLTQITIPSSVTSIGNHAFSECTSLKQIQLPSSITSIGDNAFYGCILLSNASIPSLTSIGSNIFKGCTSLVEISIPSNFSQSTNCFPPNVKINKI